MNEREHNFDRQTYIIDQSVVNNCAKGVYKNYISLGFCCHIAGNLEKLGLRSASMPYDWNVTYWRTIEDTIRNHFSNYMVKEKLYQFKNNLHCYENCDAGVSFVHDFVDYLPLDKQIKKVKRKYDRRINNFYECIKQPTLFFRYCMNCNEVITINERYNEILALIKKHNEYNQIVFLTHDSIDLSTVSNIQNIFIIQKKDDEAESTSPITGCDVLNDLLCKAQFEDREKNMKFYGDKHNTSSTKNRIKAKRKQIMKRIVGRKKYVYDKQI